MPSDDDENTGVTTNETYTMSDKVSPLRDEGSAETEQKKNENVNKSDDEIKSAIYSCKSGIVIIPSDEGVCCFLDQIELLT